MTLRALLGIGRRLSSPRRRPARTAAYVAVRLRRRRRARRN